MKALIARMISMLSSIRPNPRYVPGGTENFWISEQSECKNNVKMADTVMAEKKGKEEEGVARKKSFSSNNCQKDLRFNFPNGGLLKNVIDLKFYN